MEALDVIYAYRQVDSVISALKSTRKGSDRELKRIFAEATTLGKQLHGEKFELEQPKVNKCQIHRSNIPVTTEEEYYWVSLYNEFLSHVTAELQEIEVLWHSSSGNWTPAVIVNPVLHFWYWGHNATKSSSSSRFLWARFTSCNNGFYRILDVGEEVGTAHLRFPQKARRCSAGLQSYNILERESATSASTNSTHHILWKWEEFQPAKAH